MKLDEFEPIVVAQVEDEFAKSEFANVSVFANRIGDETMAIFAIWRITRRAFVKEPDLQGLARVGDGESFAVTYVVKEDELKRNPSLKEFALKVAWQLKDEMRAGILGDLKTRALEAA